jgi:hypothetical protein
MWLVLLLMVLVLVAAVGIPMLTTTKPREEKTSKTKVKDVFHKKVKVNGITYKVQIESRGDTGSVTGRSVFRFKVDDLPAEIVLGEVHDLEAEITEYIDNLEKKRLRTIELGEAIDEMEIGVGDDAPVNLDKDTVKKMKENPDALKEEAQKEEFEELSSLVKDVFRGGYYVRKKM